MSKARRHPRLGVSCCLGKTRRFIFRMRSSRRPSQGRSARCSAAIFSQRLNLLEWLQDSDVNPVLKVKRGTKHEKLPAYPPRALVELLVNMLVHRDYERSETASIDVEPGRTMVFRN